MIDLPAGVDARLYWQPAGFIASPVGLDGQFARLAGGMQFFSAWEVVAVADGARAGKWLVPVAEAEQAMTGLSHAQSEDARRQISRATTPRPPLILGECTIRLDQPQIMAILNVTPDSFSDGGKHRDDPEAAANAGFAMAAAGAAIVDVGGESTRPGAADVWEGDEIARVQPVIERLAKAGVAVSIDTRKAAVMEAALAVGAAMINDVAALAFDDRASEVAAAASCPVVLMHSPAPRSGPHGAMKTADPLIEVYEWLEARIEAVTAAGVARERIIVDPGIGFGKTVTQNCAILNGLALFHTLGCPVLLGASRKRLIGALSNEAPVEARLAGSLTLALAGANAGVQIVRVHDVAETTQALHVWRGLRDQALSAVG